MQSYTLNQKYEIESDRVPCVGETIAYHIPLSGKGEQVSRMRVDSVLWHVMQSEYGPTLSRAFITASPI